jgi:hypothetical protein
VTTYAGLLTSAEGAKTVAIGVCYTGPLAEGERLITPVRQFGPPLADQIRPMAYTALQRLMDTAYPARHQYYQKDHFLQGISDEVIDIMVEHFARVSSPLSIPFFQQSGGAVRRGNSAFAHRAALYNLVLSAQWLDPGESERHVHWTRELWQALRPYATGGAYVNHIGREDEDGADQVGRPTAPTIRVWRN